jgi:hypothetical protein
MSLDLYVSACNEFLWELKKSLTKEDVDELRPDCAGLGLKGWRRWTEENMDSICDYVQSTPSHRSSKKAWRDPSTRRRLVLAAIQHVYRARHLIEAVAEHNIAPGKSYRYTAALAGSVYLEVFSKDIPRWPFPGEDPFAQK